MVPNSGPPDPPPPPPEGMVPNFEPKNDLKKGQICIFGSFLGPNDFLIFFVIPSFKNEMIPSLARTSGSTVATSTWLYLQLPLNKLENHKSKNKM